MSYLDSLPLLSYSIDCLHLLLINFLGSVPNQLPLYKFPVSLLLSLSVLPCDIPGFPFQCFGLFRAPFGFSIFIFGSPFWTLFSIKGSLKSLHPSFCTLGPLHLMVHTTGIWKNLWSKILRFTLTFYHNNVPFFQLNT